MASSLDVAVDGQAGVRAQGKEVLQQLVRSYRLEYDELTLEQKKQLIREFDEHKASKISGRRVSTKSRVNDVTHTLKAIENEVRATLPETLYSSHHQHS